MTRIDRRFRGPTSSGNGGYTAGLLAAALSPTATVEVVLRHPPPLDTDLALQLHGGGATLSVHDQVVATARSVDETPQPVPAVDVRTAAAAELAYAGGHDHPFPECFVCGPRRTPGDGLLLAPGRIAPGRTACTWTPDPSLGQDGVVGAVFVWAALDCPGGWTADLAGRPLVLGSMTAQVEQLPRTGQPYLVVGAHRGDEGRKTYTASTVYDTAGRRLARAEATWIAVDPSEFR